MTSLVYLARHGQTEWHAENRYAGVSDVALTAEGRAQAHRLGAWAAHTALSAVVSSDLTRAVETAAIVAATAGLSHRVDPSLRESDFGSGEGLTRAQMRERFPDALDAFLAAPASTPLPGGETGEHASSRFLTGLRHAIEDEHPPVLVVAHTTVMRLSLCRLLGIPLDEYRRVFPDLGNATITAVSLASAGEPTGALLRYNAPTA